MIVKLLTEHHLEFLSLTGGCRGSSKSTLVKMSNCWKSHAAAQFCFDFVHSNTYIGFPKTNSGPPAPRFFDGSSIGIFRETTMYNKYFKQ